MSIPRITRLWILVTLVAVLFVFIGLNPAACAGETPTPGPPGTPVPTCTSGGEDCNGD